MSSPVFDLEALVLMRQRAIWRRLTAMEAALATIQMSLPPSAPSRTSRLKAAALKVASQVAVRLATSLMTPAILIMAAALWKWLLPLAQRLLAWL